MDKLQPVLKHKFWILLAVVLILAPMAWWMGTSPLAADSETRTAAVNNAITGVKAESDAKSTPNSKWSSALKDVNAERSARIDAEVNRLWKTQSQHMKFPAEVEKFLPKEFQGKFSDPLGRSYYRTAYEQERERLKQIVEPLKANAKVVGKVHLAASLPRAPGSPWENASIPTDQEIWAAQEDLWLLETLLSAVARVNRNHSTITEAPIKEIQLLRLRGGSREDIERRMKPKPVDSNAKATAAKPATAKRNRDKKDDDPTQSDLFKDLEGQQKGSQSQKRGIAVGMAIDLHEVFGTTAGDAAMKDLSDSVSQGSGAGGPVMIGLANREKQDEEAQKNASTANMSRYVDEASDRKKYATRGFFIQVVMNQREWPELLAELSSSHFPVEILKVHMQAYTPTGTVPTFRDSDTPDAAPAPVNNSATTGARGAPVQVDPTVDAYRRAMVDPELANVAIAGLITLYRPPSAEAAKMFAGIENKTPASTKTAPTAGSPDTAVAAPSAAAQPGSVPKNATGNSGTGSSPAANSATPPAASSTKPAAADKGDVGSSGTNAASPAKPPEKTPATTP